MRRNNSSLSTLSSGGGSSNNKKLLAKDWSLSTLGADGEIVPPKKRNPTAHKEELFRALSQYTGKKRSAEEPKAAAAQAYAMAGIGPEDIQVAEVHDCFTIAEIVDIEDLGFFEKGKGVEAVREGQTKLNGQISINSSGGLKSKGHPIGATGVGQIVEVFDQLTGKAGERTVKNAKIGLTQNFGATGASCAVHIFQSV